MSLLDIAYIINFFILILASITDIKEKIIPHKYVIAMFLINLPIGYYFFGFDAIIGMISTFILCLILSIGMGGGDVKLFTALAPIFSYDLFYFLPKPILYMIAISMLLVAIYPLFKIFRRYYKEILYSSFYLATVMGILYYIIYKLNIPYGTILIYLYIIVSIFYLKKNKKYKEISKKLAYFFPLYLLLIYLLDKEYFIKNNLLLSSIIYIFEIILIALVVYALAGAEISTKKKIDELKEGDILRDVIIFKDNDDVEVKNLSLLGRIKFMLENKEKNYLLCDGEGLSEEDIEKLKKYKDKIKELTVIETYPYVPFVTLSYVIIILLTKLNIL
ncbi:A24 family peptidase C-terminal domain-containing protein [Methanocaldococcus infernus]|uniref:Peptidase A24A domain protein n=1 Tax=Methanocaldococcus infernus (strain DSM 11812 / JCM 15783 / ME) TaxID=573063 RepID=D5VTU3_METIM|nr:A24 family peptidase C-terminal domain-containing protein [Methanocaldococcus infernus]ADG13996.1 Peptidase A24A domain protein [Methanocaldococcus infernus ME]